MQIENVIIEYRDRPEGSISKLNTYSDGIKVIRTIICLFRNYKPLAFFGILGALLALISTVFFIPVLLEYFATGLVSKFPTLIVCGFTMIAAIQSFFAGLILSNMRQKDKRDFEYHLQMIAQNKKKNMEKWNK